MADQELTYEEALRGLSELFGSDNSAPNRRRRRYLLDLKDGKLVFRFERPSPLERDELTLMLDQVFDEEFDDDIVPRKLAYLFPGSTFEPWHRSLALTAAHSLLALVTTFPNPREPLQSTSE